MKRPRRNGTPADSGQAPAIRTPALNALLLLIIANFALQPLTEPDFGWHLRTGLDLFMSGGQLPALDPYSHTMPDWPWVEHAWLTDLVLGWLYQHRRSRRGPARHRVLRLCHSCRLDRRSTDRSGDPADSAGRLCLVIVGCATVSGGAHAGSDLARCGRGAGGT